MELIQPLLLQLLLAKRALAETGPNIEIIIADTGSTDADVLHLYQSVLPEIVLATDLPYHFSETNNIAFRNHTTKRTVIFLNNDVLFSDATIVLTSMYWLLQQRPEVGVVGSYLFFPDGRLQHAGVTLVAQGNNRTACSHRYGRETIVRPAAGSSTLVPAVTGAALMTQSDLFESLGGFDPRYSTECQDVDFCLAVWRSGRKVLVSYFGDVVHFEGATRSNDDDNLLDRSLLARKWANFVEFEDFQ